MEKMLTEKQQELVEKNHNLIYEFAKNKNLALDEYYGILAIALCKAALAYDECKGQFSTIAYWCMNNALKEYYRHINRQRAIPEDKLFSYDVQLNAEDSISTYIDMIADTCCVSDTVINKIMLESIVGKLTIKERIVYNLLKDGMNQNEIANQIGCSKQNVGHYIKQIRKKWLKLNSNN